MKTNCYKLLFRIFSFFSDRTNGASLFVKYKLIFGTILIEISTISCVKQHPLQPTCYKPALPIDSAQTEKFEVTNQEDTITTHYDKTPDNDTSNNESMITCYLPDLPSKPE